MSAATMLLLARPKGAGGAVNTGLPTLEPNPPVIGTPMSYTAGTWSTGTPEFARWESSADGSVWATAAAMPNADSAPTDAEFGLLLRVVETNGGVTAESAATGAVAAAYDTFTDTNGVSLDAHVPQAAAPWVEGHGDFDIQSNRANVVALGASPAVAIATIDTGQSDCTITAVVRIGASAAVHAGVVVRYLDKDNFITACYRNGRFTIVRWVAGTPTQLVLTNDPVITANTEHVVEVVLNGDSISATLDGAFPLNTTSSAGQTRTKHGLYAEQTGQQFDLFQVTA